MSEDDTPKFDNSWLLCPKCKGDCLHHAKVEVFERLAEDSKKGHHVTVNTDTYAGSLLKMAVDNKLARNPSSRRGGIIITFNCEHCGNKSELTLAQHKGCTITSFN